MAEGVAVGGVPGGEGVGLGPPVFVSLAVGVGVAVDVSSAVLVAVGVEVDVGCVCVAVALCVTVLVGVDVGVGIGAQSKSPTATSLIPAPMAGEFATEPSLGSMTEMLFEKELRLATYAAEPSDAKVTAIGFRPTVSVSTNVLDGSITATSSSKSSVT